MQNTYVVQFRQDSNMHFQEKDTTRIDNLSETARLNLPSNFFTFMAAKDGSNVDNGDNCIDRYQVYMLLKLQCI